MSVANRGVEFTLQNAATTGNGTAATCPVGAKDHLVIIKGSGTTSGGTISIEEADDETYTGTWSVILAVNASDVTGNAEKNIHWSSQMTAVRARISSNITGGGTITALYVAN